jgi:hypothetical protein
MFGLMFEVEEEEEEQNLWIPTKAHPDINGKKPTLTRAEFRFSLIVNVGAGGGFGMLKNDFRNYPC